MWQAGKKRSKFTSLEMGRIQVGKKARKPINYEAATMDLKKIDIFHITNLDALLQTSTKLYYSIFTFSLIKIL